MDEPAWHDAMAKSIMVFLNGSAIPEPDKRGERTLGDSFLVMFNAHDQPITFTLPDEEYGRLWIPEVDTAAREIDAEEFEPGWQIQVDARSVVVLRSPQGADA
jgi:glycogen operon protein